MGYRGKTHEQARRTGPHDRPNRLRDRRLAEISEMDAAGLVRIGTLSDQAFLVAGVALDAGEGAKQDGVVKFANTDPEIMRFFCSWLRHLFTIDEDDTRPDHASEQARVRMRVCHLLLFRTHRAVMGMIRALLSAGSIPG